MTTESDPRTWLLDANVLVALALTNHVHHQAAHQALQAAPAWATCSITENALLRLLLNPAVAGARFSTPDVAAVLRGMRAHPSWTFLADACSLAEPTIDVSVLSGHQQVTDLHLINLAASHGAVLASFDAAIVQSLAPADREHVRVLRQ